MKRLFFWGGGGGGGGKVRANQKNKVNRDGSKRLPTTSPSILLAIGSQTNVTIRVESRGRGQGAHV